MSSPVPQGLMGGAASASVLALAEECSRAVQTVEDHLRKQDVKGADEYLTEFEGQFGTRAHNTVMKMLQQIYGSPDWRTFA